MNPFFFWVWAATTFRNTCFASLIAWVAHNVQHNMLGLILQIRTWRQMSALSGFRLGWQAFRGAFTTWIFVLYCETYHPYWHILNRLLYIFYFNRIAYSNYDIVSDLGGIENGLGVPRISWPRLCVLLRYYIWNLAWLVRWIYIFSAALLKWVE